MPRAPASGHLIGSLVAHQLLQAENAFRLPSHFPRHYLTTVSGEPEDEARLPSEAGWEEERDGWVWIDQKEKMISCKGRDYSESESVDIGRVVQIH